MKKLLFIDACIRKEDSRTRALAAPVIKKLKERYEVETISLCDADIAPVTASRYTERAQNGPSPEDAYHAGLFASSDRVVIAAPFWDMSFPSVLKVFFERISLPDFTFVNTPDGSTRGNCKAEKLLYITTRGLDIPTGDARDQGTSYLKALGWLWGIPEILTVAAWGTDVTDDDTRARRLADALSGGLLICEDF